MQQVDSAQQAVEVAANQAVLASLQTTFAVGAALIENATGAVVMVMHNNVLEPYPGGDGAFTLHDPTAHGERQLVDWYYAIGVGLGLPEPSKMTVVTSLDPCAMCAGALLTAGFNVAVSAIDTFAGVNYNCRQDFPTLPPQLRALAQRTWGYYGVHDPFNRAYAGGSTPVFTGESIDALTYEVTLLVFSASVDAVRAASSSGGTEPAKMSDPERLPSSSPVRQALTALYPQTLTVTSGDPRFPGVEFAAPLVAAAKQAASRGAAYNSVALLDPFGNLLVCLGGAEEDSPVRTAFLETTREYAMLRWRLMNDPNSAVRAEATSYLAHATYCTFVHLTVPDPRTAQAVMTFGAYGSTMEGSMPQIFPSSFQYAQLPGGVGEQDVARLAAALPPFYTTSVGVAPQRVLDQELIAATARS
jgi:cytosine deaminase